MKVTSGRESKSWRNVEPSMSSFGGIMPKNKVYLESDL